MQVQIRKWSLLLRPAVVAAASCLFISIVLIMNGCSFEYFRLCFPVSNRRIFTTTRTSFKSTLMAAF